ncbi:zinc finger BED domain-containing protein 4-like [Palaemon carinicauda]|uniref:zinc finger BED domain-containing protein 4-like n=1 Tax=Palaemon carinicauda TaxID=392227 RepID=UPI0035B69CE1
MQIKQQPCFAHTLNLVVQDSIKNTNKIKLSQEKIKRIVSFFHHSVKATDKLSEIQNQNGVERKKLIMDVDTRWNSTFYMMERFLEQHEAITTTLCLLGKSNMCLSSEELEVVKGAVLLLGPFEEATREMSTENFTSLSKVIPITRALQQCINSNAHMRTGFGTELQKQLQKRFATVEKVFQLGAATLLDVRFKNVSFVDMGNVKVTEERIMNLMRSEYSQEEINESVPVPHVSQSSETESHINEEQAKRGSLWQCFDAKVETTMKSQRLTSIGPHIELRRYLEEPIIPRDEDPLKWWKMHSVLFPKLHALAKKFLCIPATSVPSERLFSKAGELISHRRSALSDKNINMILFFNKNM